MSRRLVLGLALASLVLPAAPGRAGHSALHGRPLSPAYDFFPPDFGPVYDSEWDPVWQSERGARFPVGGFGGIDRAGQIVEKDAPWLADLNAAPDEFGTAAVMTVYDGTGAADVGYLTPAYADSPRLGDIVPGAVDCAYGRGHNDLRLDAAIVAAYRTFLEAAGAGGSPDDPCGPGGTAQ